ncbi:MAG: hypothetical protein AAFP10_04335 [Pseudomonadota bacterium]
MPAQQIIFGLGTGRCGTMSLMHLLNSQHNAAVSHELLEHRIPWSGGKHQVDKVLTSCRATNASLTGDVGFYYLPYVEYILTQEPSCRFICLKRDRAATIQSYLRKTDGKNHWKIHDGTSFRYCEWDACYPKYTIADKSKAIGLYWDEYYRRVKQLSDKYPHAILITSTASLNTGVDHILDYAYVSRSARIYPDNICLNASLPDSYQKTHHV